MPRIAVPLPTQLEGLAPGWAAAFDRAVDRFRALGHEVVEVDIAPLLDAATLLYDGAFVAERYAAVGAHIEANRDRIGEDLDPTVAAIVLGGATPTAAALFADQERLDALGARGRTLLDGTTALLTPTTTWHRPSTRSPRTRSVRTAGWVGTRTSRTSWTWRPSRCRPASWTGCRSASC